MKITTRLRAMNPPDAHQWGDLRKAADYIDRLEECLGGFVKNRRHIESPDFQGVLDRLMDMSEEALSYGLNPPPPQPPHNNTREPSPS